ncbi:MAG: hypothetical protein WB763_11530 [Terriglobia bacterium]|jgi:hypothetical protein
MSLLKRSLTNLWRHQATTPNPPRPGPGQFPDRIVVSIREPMKISGTVLSSGRYVFRLLDPGAERDHVQIFNEDQTRLVATFTAVPNS